MSFFDGILDKMKLSSEDDDYDDDDDIEEDEVPSKRKSRRERAAQSSEDLFDTEEAKQPAKPAVKKTVRKEPTPVAPVRSNKVVSMRKAYNSGMEVCVFKPTNIDDGRDISDTLLNGKAVVLNLEGLDVSLAQRIIDFTSGACYSIHGNLQKVSNYIFIITPESVDISGDFQELINSDFSLPSGSDF